MTVAELQDAIDVSDNSYYRFMKQSGPTKGTQTDTFMGAVIFFKKRELAGLKMPRKKKTKTNGDDGKDKAGAGGKKSSSQSKADQEKALDVSGIKLEGEETDSVPIYLTCDDIRSMTNAHLRNTSATQASFCRAIAGMFTNPPKQGTSTAALHTFLSYSGPAAGASKACFYGAYVYFEKLRIKQGKPKSKKRTEMEEVWGPKGMDRHDMTKPVFMRGDERIVADRFGHVDIKEKDWLPPDDGAGWKVWSMKAMSR
jgi:hypothetical protein